MKSRLALACAAVLSLGDCGMAADIALSGVWKGTVGKYPVMACFDLGEGFHFGSYYYLSQLKLIRLSESDGGKGWTEETYDGQNSIGPRWDIDMVDRSTVRGSWHSGGKSLVVNLQRVAGPANDEDNICGTDTFNGARFTPAKENSSPAQLDGIGYTKLSVDVGKQFDADISSFALAGESEGVRKVNAAMRAPLAVDGSDSDFRNCMLGAAGSLGTEGSYSSSNVPVLILKNFLVAKWEAGDFCGGAHPNYGEGYDIYDLQSGDKLDLGTWFDMAKALPIVKQVVRARVADGSVEKDCGEAILDNEYWTYGLSREGLLFLPDLPHAMQACGTEFTVPFGKAQGFLTEAGKAVMARTRSEID